MLRVVGILVIYILVRYTCHKQTEATIKTANELFGDINESLSKNLKIYKHYLPSRTSSISLGIVIQCCSLGLPY